MAKTKRNPHMLLTAIDPPRNQPPRRFRCDYCGMIGLYDDLRQIDCTHVYPPCKDCGQTPECAPNCRGIAAALAQPGVAVVGAAGDIRALRDPLTVTPRRRTSRRRPD